MRRLKLGRHVQRALHVLAESNLTAEDAYGNSLRSLVCCALEGNRRLKLQLETCVAASIFCTKAGRTGNSGPGSRSSKTHASKDICLALALSVGATLGVTKASCDASGVSSALNDARRKIVHIWNEACADMDRIEASLPHHRHLPRPKCPEVKFKGGQISIKFPIAREADPSDVLRGLVLELGKTGQNIAVQETEASIKVADCNAAQVIHLNGGGSGMAVQVYIPHTHIGTPEVEFLCNPEDQLDDADLRIILSTFMTANGLGERIHRFPFDLAKHFLPDSGLMDNLALQLGSLFKEELEGWHGNMLDELERLGLPSPKVLAGPMPGAEEEEPSLDWDELSRAQERSSYSSDESSGSTNQEIIFKRLEKLGAVVYAPKDSTQVDWGVLAGYEEQKEQISETLLMSLLHPEIYDEVSSKTRKHSACNRPRAVLFEGPPGCGKTTSARILAQQASAPLIYVPVEAIASKWYGESERNLSEIFKAAEELGVCLVFLDEIDSLATQRSSEMHEATRRILGVVLRQLDGFEGRRSITIGATNRKSDLDPALLSRFDTSIYFQLPNKDCRQQILKQFAQHLSDTNLHKLAEGCEGMSGRDLRNVCEQAERRHAYNIIREHRPRGSLPETCDYMDAIARHRAKAWGTANMPNDLVPQLQN